MIPDLGKYAGTVLGAYAVSLILLGGIVLLSWLRSRRIRRKREQAESRRADG